MSKFYLTHTALAVAMMAAVWIITGNELAGAAWSSGFYFSREMNQYQTKLAKTLSVDRSSIWHRGWLPWSWGYKSAMQFVCPALVCLALVWII